MSGLLPTMGHKRKRPVKNDPPSSQISSSRFNLPSRGEPTHHPHPVISLYYPRVLTLRQFLLQHLPSSSKSRRRRILSLRGFAADNKNASDQRHDVQSLANFLDTTLIGVPKESVPAVDSSRQRDFAAFSQSQDTSQSSDTGPSCPQSEVLTCHLQFYRLSPTMQDADYPADCQLRHIITVQSLRVFIPKTATPVGPWLPASYWSFSP
jgi:hypothetical protein